MPIKKMTKLQRLEAAVAARLRPVQVKIVIDEQARMRLFGLDPDNPTHLREWAKAKAQRAGENQLRELKAAWEAQWERRRKAKAKRSPGSKRA
jgi:hypothetical protein